MIVKRYIAFAVENRLTYMYKMCPRCVDSELPLQPGVNNNDEVFLFCLMPGCKYKSVVGLNTLESMKRELLARDNVFRKIS